MGGPPLLGFVLTVSLLVMAQGCSRSQITRPPPETDALIGVWLETRDPNDPGIPARLASLQASIPEYRMLEIFADGNYTLTLTARDGTPADQEPLHGTWRVIKSVVRFDPPAAADQPLAPLAPRTSMGIVRLQGAAGDEIERLRIMHANDDYVVYRRKVP